MSDVEKRTDHALEVWDLVAGKRERQLDVWYSSNKAAPTLLWSPNGKLLLAHGTGTFASPVKVFDTTTWTEQIAATLIFGADLAMSADGTRGAAIGVAYQLATFELPSGKLLKEGPYSEGHAMGGISLSRDGRVVVSAFANNIDIARAADHVRLARFQEAVVADGGRPPVSAQGDLIAVFSAKYSGVVDARTGARLRAFTPVRSGLGIAGQVAWSPDGARVALAQDNEPADLQVFDVATGKRLATIARADERFPAYGPDGAYLATAAGRDTKSVIVRDGRSGAKVAEIAGAEWVLGWIGPRELLVIGETIASYEVPSMRRLRTLVARRLESSAASISKDGRLLALDVDGLVRLVRIADGASVDIGAVVIDGSRQPFVFRADGAYEGPDDAMPCFLGAGAHPRAHGLVATLAAKGE